MKLFKSIAVASLIALSTLSVGHAQSRNTRTVINCSSNGHAYNTCYVGEGIEFVTLLNQISRSACIQGNTWGISHDSIWVDKGCRANFEVIRRGGIEGRHDGGRDDRHCNDRNERVINCSSNGHAYNTCYVGRDIDYVKVSQQLSRAICSEGNSWGYSDDSIWVDKGCRANFKVIMQGRRGCGNR